MKDDELWEANTAKELEIERNQKLQEQVEALKMELRGKGILDSVVVSSTLDQLCGLSLWCAL
jgi:hypothetical protein